MALIELETVIDAPLTVCFDLARNIDLHQQTTARSGERAVAGRTSGLIEQGESVTWEATHFGVRQRLSVVITDMNPPRYFADTMTRGAFKALRHEHFFARQGDKTIMRDRFAYQPPFGLVGALFDTLMLKGYMTRFLVERNRVLKSVAETGSLPTGPK